MISEESEPLLNDSREATLEQTQDLPSEWTLPVNMDFTIYVEGRFADLTRSTAANLSIQSIGFGETPCFGVKKIGKWGKRLVAIDHDLPLIAG